ncbi:MAG: peptidoglycan DD-metalloendopeptidase family protein [Chloroflexi bacterium]|nr:peptidoglycan DD-metalloendopeptidase family protein [Chloroflexota bacterium]
MTRLKRFLFAPVFFLILLLNGLPAGAQQLNAVCGVVDSIRYPLDDIVEMRQGFDDFGLYRERFGGLHTGVDIGFDRLGDPVYAAARGRVTYSDIAGWDTEKGVVIVEHTFPDSSVYYTVYGHVEQTDTIFLPQVDQCVEMGQVIAAVGWPSRGRPHLHYEVRTFMPGDGGPGYVDESPLLDGWLHPLDFTMLWQMRLLPGYVSYATFRLAPSLPPVALDNGGYAIASADVVQGVDHNGVPAWSVQGSGVIIGLAALPGSRVAAYTRSGQVLVVQEGRYRALWSVNGPEEAFVLLPNTETLVFLTDNGLAAYQADGTLRWNTTTAGGRVSVFEAGDSQILLGARGEAAHVWSIFEADSGAVTGSGTVTTSLAAAPGTNGDWYLLDGARISRFADGELSPLANLGQTAGRTARLTAAADRVYVYTADASGTLLALDMSGQVLWRVAYPYAGAATLPPLLAADGDCTLYALDVNGVLNAFNASDGTLLRQAQMYPGGTLTASPRARLLTVDGGGVFQMGAGFLSMVTMDGRTLFGSACLAG